MKIHILQLLFHKCWVACQSSARLNNIHAWNLYKHSVSHRETNIKRPSLTSVEEYGWSLTSVICLSMSVLPNASCELPSIDQSKTKHTAFPFRVPQSTLNRTFLSYDLKPPRDLMAFHWWPPPHEASEKRGTTKRRRGKTEGVCVCGAGGDSVGCSVTLEEIRRLSSPLMTAEIVFQWGEGGMPELSSLFFCSFKSFLCQVQVACLSSPGSGPLSLSH